jgi:thioredoxin 1
MNQAATKPVDVTDKDFASEVLQSDTPVLVDFWAEWCGPCRVLGPVIESLSEDYDGKVKVAKVDVDANQQVAMQFGIRSIPTVILFDKGQVVDTFIGVRPRSDYDASLNKVVA